jgi:hypothetical protein
MISRSRLLDDLQQVYPGLPGFQMISRCDFQMILQVLIAWRILDLEDLDSLEDHSLEDTWNTWRSSENPIYLEEDLEYHLKIAPADHLKTWKT